MAGNSVGRPAPRIPDPGSRIRHPPGTRGPVPGTRSLAQAWAIDSSHGVPGTGTRDRRGQRDFDARDHGDDDEGQHAARGAALGAINTKRGAGAWRPSYPAARRRRARFGALDADERLRSGAANARNRARDVSRERRDTSLNLLRRFSSRTWSRTRGIPSSAGTHGIRTTAREAASRADRRGTDPTPHGRRPPPPARVPPGRRSARCRGGRRTPLS